MKFLSGLFGRKSGSKPQAKPVSGVEVDEDWNALSAAPAEAVAPAVAPKAAAPSMADDFEADDVDAMDLSSVETVLDGMGKPRASRDAVNIWDLEEDEAAPEAAAPAPQQSSRARRNRTRLIGFDTSEGDVVDLFDEAPAAVKMEKVQFPVGWMLVVEGPGLGHCFAMVAGMSQIGRGDDQQIQLDFGDNAISRKNHAAIVYDPEERTFTLGHGGKANIVRLNGKPVISNEEIKDGAKVQIGETTLQLKTLCDADFDWSDISGGEEQEDVAIA